jgi:hypothetical protein
MLQLTIQTKTFGHRGWHVILEGYMNHIKIEINVGRIRKDDY